MHVPFLSFAPLAWYAKPMIPNNLRAFFWEVDADRFDPHEYRDYVIGRILELGNDTAVAWMKSTFTEEQIKKVIREDRHLSPKSATFWALMYRIPAEEIAALGAQPTRSR
jgi:hypothetical protein